MSGRKPAREPDVARAESRRGHEHVVETRGAEPRHLGEPCAQVRECAAALEVLALRVGVHVIDVRVPFEDRGVVAVDERLDARFGKAPTQGGEHRRGEHQVADVVAANDEDLQGCWRARHDSNVRPLPSEGSTLSS